MARQVQASKTPGHPAKRGGAKSATSVRVKRTKPITESAVESRYPFPIVAVGASAGGLDALEQFLGHVPVGSGMAFVVIQHFDPNHKGMMPELLQRATAMPVAQAKNRMKVKPGCVYVIPPNHDLSILHDTLDLLELTALGQRAIKEKGGLILVQNPAAAKFDSLPKSVINAGLADVVAAPEDLPQRIIDILQHGARPAVGTAEPFPARKSGFEKICILLRARAGHDFSFYKKTTVYRRIERRMAIHKIKRISDYVRYLRENPQEADLQFKELVIGVTSFFRDPATWAYLQEQTLPALFAACPARCRTACLGGRSFHRRRGVFAGHGVSRSAGTLEASGAPHAPDIRHRPRSRCDREGASGRLSRQHRRRCCAERLMRFFVEDGNGYRVGKDIREMVVFAAQNVVMELHARSEEMQTSQEKLKSANEKMQSLNEELQTVNLELQSKLDELSLANNDMKNLLNSTDMATVFLDNALHVRRFTTQATRIFRLIASDVDYPGLLDDAAEVLRTLAFSEREIATADGRWFQVKIMPYRTLDNVIDGVVITLNDIGRAKRLEAELRLLGSQEMAPS
jgi:hypothetical protein